MRQKPSNPQPHGEESSCNLHHQLRNATSIDEHSNASIDTQPLPSDLHNDNDLDSGYLTPYEFGIFRDPEGNARAMDGRLLQVSKEDITDILAIANGQGNLFTQATPPDPDPYSRAEMDEKLNDIYTIQYDSMNDFKCKLDSVYHPLNDKITWLTKTIEHLADGVTTIMRQKIQGVSARKPRKPSTSNEFPHHTSTDDRLIPSTDDRLIPSTGAAYPRSIDTNIKQSINRRFTILEEKLYSFEERFGSSYYPMSDDKNALETRMDALQQEMDMIQNQLDFHLKTSPSIDMTTRT